MKDQLLLLKEKTFSALTSASNLEELESLKVSVLGKKGELTQLLKSVSDIPLEERPIIGQLANEVKTELFTALTTRQKDLEKKLLEVHLANDTTDPTLPKVGAALGHEHPLNQTIRHLVKLFNRLGFSVKEGPDIETDFYNFEALNIPKNHPARDMHDTFYMSQTHLLRTHTSPVQIHTLETHEPPIKIIVPGKVYRCDADVTHSPVFHQIEGLYVDKNVTFADLKGTLEFFLKELFGSKLKVRFRPSYFPFTEPSAEVDVQCVKCSGKGCSLCKQTGWLEILGSGMVNRKVFRHVNIDPDVYTGFAFGMGVERIAMLTYAVDDIRLFYENDLRFLSQF